MNTAARPRRRPNKGGARILGHGNAANSPRLRIWHGGGRWAGCNCAAGQGRLTCSSPRPSFPMPDRAVLAEACALAGQRSCIGASARAGFAGRHPDDQRYVNLVKRMQEMDGGRNLCSRASMRRMMARLALGGAALARPVASVGRPWWSSPPAPRRPDTPVGTKVDDNATITLKAGDVVTVLTAQGTRVIKGAGTFRCRRPAAGRIGPLCFAHPQARRDSRVRTGGGAPANRTRQ